MSIFKKIMAFSIAVSAIFTGMRYDYGTNAVDVDTENTGISYSLGNVNGDDVIDSLDASLILKEYASLTTEGKSSLTDEQKAAYDIDGNGIVDSADATVGLGYYAYVSVTVGETVSIENYLVENPDIPEATTTTSTTVTTTTIATTTTTTTTTKATTTTTKPTTTTTTTTKATTTTTKPTTTTTTSTTVTTTTQTTTTTGGEASEYTTSGGVEIKELKDILQVDRLGSEDGSPATYTFKCETDSDCPFTRFDIYKRDEGEEGLGLPLYTKPLDGSNVLNRSYTFTENGTYDVIIWAFRYNSVTVHITINSIIPQVVMQDDFVDNTAPEIYLDVPDITGLSQGSVFNFGVSTNEECTIRVGADVFSDTTQATGTAYGNGDVSIVAVDSWGNRSTAVVKITAFGDGSITPPRKSHRNDNPLSKVDKESYYGFAATGSLNGVAGDGSSSSSDRCTES